MEEENMMALLEDAALFMGILEDWKYSSCHPKHDCQIKNVVKESADVHDTDSDNNGDNTSDHEFIIVADTFDGNWPKCFKAPLHGHRWHFIGRGNDNSGKEKGNNIQTKTKLDQTMARSLVPYNNNRHGLKVNRLDNKEALPLLMKTLMSQGGCEDSVTDGQACNGDERIKIDNDDMVDESFKDNNIPTENGISIDKSESGRTNDKTENDKTVDKSENGRTSDKAEIGLIGEDKRVCSSISKETLSGSTINEEINRSHFFYMYPNEPGIPHFEPSKSSQDSWTPKKFHWISENATLCNLSRTKRTIAMLHPSKQKIPTLPPSLSEISSPPPSLSEMPSLPPSLSEISPLPPLSSSSIDVINFDNHNAHQNGMKRPKLNQAHGTNSAIDKLGNLDDDVDNMNTVDSLDITNVVDTNLCVTNNADSPTSVLHPPINTTIPHANNTNALTNQHFSNSTISNIRTIDDTQSTNMPDLSAFKISEAESSKIYPQQDIEINANHKDHSTVLPKPSATLFTGSSAMLAKFEPERNVMMMMDRETERHEFFKPANLETQDFSLNSFDLIRDTGPPPANISAKNLDPNSLEQFQHQIMLWYRFQQQQQYHIQQTQLPQRDIPDFSLHHWNEPLTRIGPTLIQNPHLVRNPTRSAIQQPFASTVSEAYLNNHHHTNNSNNSFGPSLTQSNNQQSMDRFDSHHSVHIYPHLSNGFTPLSSITSPFTSQMQSQQNYPRQHALQSSQRNHATHRQSSNGTSTLRFSNPTTPTKQCSNCGAIQTPSWRRCPKGKQLLCNACGLYAKLHNRPRPFRVAEDGSIRVQRTLATSTGLECNDVLEQASPSSSILNQNMDKLAVEATIASEQCANCGSRDTPLWRTISAEGEAIEATNNLLCNACAVYHKSHKAHCTSTFKQQGSLQIKEPNPNHSIPYQPSVNNASQSFTPNSNHFPNDADAQPRIPNE